MNNSWSKSPINRAGHNDSEKQNTNNRTYSNSNANNSSNLKDQAEESQLNDPIMSLFEGDNIKSVKTSGPKRSKLFNKYLSSDSVDNTPKPSTSGYQSVMGSIINNFTTNPPIPVFSGSIFNASLDKKEKEFMISEDPPSLKIHTGEPKHALKSQKDQNKEEKKKTAEGTKKESKKSKTLPLDSAEQAQLQTRGFSVEWKNNEYNPFENYSHGVSITNYQKKQLDNVSKQYEYADVVKWTKMQFPWDEEIASYNYMLFGNTGFRPNQKAIINATKSKRDVFVCMPTGGGKSLTFQLPAITDNGVTIVIMPLLSLIVDQVSQLLNKGINVRDLSGNKTDKFSKREMMQEVLEDNGPKMIFLTPEKISRNDKVMDFLTELHQENLLERIVIDEAHCVTQWGKDFRADYLKLGILKEKFPNVCILALTATAPEIVRKDVIDKLHMRNVLYFQSSFNRPNLIYFVKQKTSSVIADIADFISSTYPKKTGIVYCCTTKECEQVATALKGMFKLKATAYHGKMSENKRVEVQNQWMLDEVLIICATIAFGMGINKPDVRFVIHYSFPKSLTNYYQESGRAGRDGLQSHCIIYYRPEDKVSHDNIMKHNQSNTVVNQSENIAELSSVIRYCEEKVSCRRVMQLSYLGEKFTREQCQKKCDNCMNELEHVERDYTREAIKIAECLEENKNANITLRQLAYMLMGKTTQKKTNPVITKKLFGFLKNISEDEIKKVLKEMMFQKILNEKFINNFGHVNAYLCLGTKEALKSLINGNLKVVLKIARRKAIIPKLIDHSQSTVSQAISDSHLSTKSKKVTTLRDIPLNFSNKSQTSAETARPDQFTADILKSPDNTEETTRSTKPSIKDLYKEFTAHNSHNRSCLVSRPSSAEKTPLGKNLISEMFKNSSLVSKEPLKNQANRVQPTKAFSKEFGYCTEEQFEEILDRLKLIRKKLYNETKVKDLMTSQTLVDNLENIFPTSGLHELCRKLPTSKEELTVDNIKNVGFRLLNQFGERFLEEIKHFIRMNKINKEEFYISEAGINSEPENFDIRDHLQEEEENAFVSKSIDWMDFGDDELDETGMSESRDPINDDIGDINVKNLSLQSPGQERWSPSLVHNGVETERNREVNGPKNDDMDDEYLDIIDQMLKKDQEEKENLLEQQDNNPSKEINESKRPRPYDDDLLYKTKPLKKMKTKEKLDFL